VGRLPTLQTRRQEESCRGALVSTQWGMGGGVDIVEKAGRDRKSTCFPRAERGEEKGTWEKHQLVLPLFGVVWGEGNQRVARREEGRRENTSGFLFRIFGKTEARGKRSARGGGSFQKKTVEE